MLYALITTISAAHPTATPIPTPIPSPTPLPVFITLADGLNTADNWGIVLQIISILATVFLGYAALSSSNTANKIAQQQLKYQNRIDIFDKVINISRFFSSVLGNREFFNEENKRQSNDKMYEIMSMAKYIFDDVTYGIIVDELLKYVKYLSDGILPNYDYLIEEYVKVDKPIDDEYLALLKANPSEGNSFFLFTYIPMRKVFAILKDYNLTNIENKSKQKGGL